VKPLSCPLEWLSAQETYPKVYWESRSGDHILAAVGAAQSQHTIPSPITTDRYFGGLSFCSKTWEHFPQCYFFIPQIVYEYRHETGHPPPSLFLSRQKLKPIAHTESITFNEWSDRVKDILSLIRVGQLEKIVLGKRSTFTFSHTLCPFSLLKNLKEQTKNRTLFAFQMTPTHAFIGATPEKLYTRRNHHITCDVLAASAPLINPHHLQRIKEQHEFSCVKTYIHNILTQHCHSVKLSQDCILTTATLHHLYNQIEGILYEKNDATLITSLHPTPAMAGIPHIGALEYLNKYETFTRGWYAAPIGWITQDEADISVGIRSAHIEGNQLHCFAAAGIVEGSEPEREWEELDHKISPFHALLDSC
jgi:menaquinone-specific isochorismate synthase